MKFKVKILLFFILFVGTNSFSSSNLTSEIEENQVLGMDCSIYSNSIESFIIEYKQMCNLLPMACQLHLKSTAAKLKNTIDLMVQQKLNEYLVNVERMKSHLIEIKKSSDKDNFGSFNQAIKCTVKSETVSQSEIVDKKNNIIYETLVSIIQNGDAELGYELYLKLEKTFIDLKTLIISVYDNKVANADKIMDFLHLFSEDEDIILGYRLLFDQMTIKEHIYSSPTITRMAYRIFVDFKQRFINNENLLHLRAYIPESLRNFPWNEKVCQRNVKLSETIWYQDHPAYHHGDNFRLLTFTHNSMATDSVRHSLKFIPVASGKYFLIKSIEFEEYVYADTDEFDFNSEQRSVFGWRKPNIVKESGRWQLEPIFGSPYFKIKNIYWNEYLATAENVNKIKGRPDLHQLFTLKTGRCDNALCNWDIIRYTGV